MKHILFSLCFLFFVNSSAHFNQNIALLGTFTMPFDDFSDDDRFEYDGFALVGFGGILQHSVTLGHPSFAIASDISFIVNFFDHDEAEDEMPWNLIEDLGGGHYFNIPILSGIRLTVPIKSPVIPYGTAQIGMDIFMESDLDGEIAGVNFDMDFETDVNFAWCMGGGVIIDRHIIIGVHYLNMGEPDIEYQIQIGDDDPDTERREFDASMVKFSIGYIF